MTIEKIDSENRYVSCMNLQISPWCDRYDGILADNDNEEFL